MENKTYNELKEVIGKGDWKQVREGIKPELQAARAEHFAEKLQELDSYSQEELDELLKKVEALKTA